MSLIRPRSERAECSFVEPVHILWDDVICIGEAVSRRAISHGRSGEDDSAIGGEGHYYLSESRRAGTSLDSAMHVARHAPQLIGLLTASIGGLGGNGRTHFSLSNRLREEGSPCS